MPSAAMRQKKNIVLNRLTLLLQNIIDTLLLPLETINLCYTHFLWKA